MDIIKRAYLKISEEIEGTIPDDEVIRFQNRVREEVSRLIKEGAYSHRDWPRELGPLPDELRSKREKASKFVYHEECTEGNPCCDRRGEYNGFSSGPLLFLCPKHCSCHD